MPEEIHYSVYLWINGHPKRPENSRLVGRLGYYAGEIDAPTHWHAAYTAKARYQEKYPDHKVESAEVSGMDIRDRTTKYLDF